MSSQTEVGTDAGAPEVSAEAPFLGRDKIVLLLALITYGVGQSLLYVVFPPIVKTIGLSMTQYGLILSISNLVLAFAATRWGRLSDKKGRKPILLLGLFGYGLGTLLVALGLEWGLRGSPGPWLLFAALLTARVIYGSLASAIQPSATAYIADTTAPEKRAQGMALMGMTAGVGTILGPSIGGALAFISVVFPMYAVVALSVCSILLVAFMLPEPKTHVDQDKEKPESSLSPWDSRVFPYLLMWFFFFLFFTMIQTITAFYLEDQIGLSEPRVVAQTVSIALVSMAICVVIMQAVVIQKFKISARTMVRLASPAFAAGLAVLIFANSVPLVVLGFVLFGISLSFASPGFNGGASLAVESHEQGALGGYLASAPILGMVIAPILGPVAFEMLSALAPLWMALVAMVVLSVYAMTIKVPDDR